MLKKNKGELKFSELLHQINNCIEQKSLMVAVMTSLTIPDIAGAISSKNGLACQKKYADWFDKYCKPKFKYPNIDCLTGDDCYYLRCSLLHQGKAEHQQLDSFSDIILCKIPQATNWPCPVFQTKENILLVEPKTFCNKIISAAFDWLEENHADPYFKKNTDRFLELYSLKFDI